MPEIISSKETQSRIPFFSRVKLPRALLIIAAVCAIGIGAYITYTIVRPPVAETTTEAALMKALEAKRKALEAKPNDQSARNAYADAQSQLLNYYLANKDYDKAERLSSDTTAVQKLQLKAIMLEREGDIPGAIAALKEQVEYYKKLPNKTSTQLRRMKMAELELERLEAKRR